MEGMDEAGPPTRRPAVKGGGALGPLRALLTGRVSEVRGGRYLPQHSEERGGHRGAVRGGGSLCAHSGRGVPSDRIAVFPLVWAVAFISSRAFQGRGPRKREGQTDGQRTNLMRSDERDVGSRRAGVSAGEGLGSRLTDREGLPPALRVGRVPAAPPAPQHGRPPPYGCAPEFGPDESAHRQGPGPRAQGGGGRPFRGRLRRCGVGGAGRGR